VQLSKKSIEKDLEKVHRQLTEKTKYKKPTGIDKDITKEPKLKTKPVDKSVSKKNDFFENGIPKFDFSGSKNDKKTAEDKAIVKKSEKPVDPIKNDDVTVKVNSDKKKKEESVISEMPVISIPSDKKEEPQVTATKEDGKPIEAKPAPAVTDSKPTREKTEPEKKPVKEKPSEDKLPASDDKPVKDKAINDKPTKEKPPEVKQKPKQDKKADMGWGRDKKKRLSK
ncbi:MAG: hypothetical protein GY865_04600, partial [candidate division Zixibacteria bacterium]|nr:hypothetical protein [candidate division Zixibacteria bacterium]